MFKAVEFTKSNLDNLRKDLDSVLSKYSKESGVHFNVGNITYSASEAKIKLSATLATSANIVKTQEEKAFDMYSVFDSVALKLGKHGTSSSLGEVKFVGYKSRNVKYPYIVEQIKTGTRYKMDASSARRICPSAVGV